MKFRFNLILVFTLIFILGVFCVSSCKKANEEPIEATEEPVETRTCVEEVIPLINDTVARETQFADPTANYSDKIRDGLANKICEDLDRMNKAFEEGSNMSDIAQILREIRKPGEISPSPPGQIISYFNKLRHGDPNTGELPVENFKFEFAGAVVVPVNIDKPVVDDQEPNFISLNAYIFTFDLSSGSGSTDPGGSGDGEGIHRKVYTWEN